MAALARPRRSRRRRDRPRARATALRGALVLIAGIVLVFQLLRLYNGVPTTNYRYVYVSTPMVGNLLSHDAVRIAGKRIGQVLQIDLGNDGQPRVKLQLDPGTRLPADTHVRVRANGLLGARYVELVAGKSRSLLADDAVIRGTTSSYTFGLPEAVEVFDQRTRAGLRDTVGELGAGMLTNGDGLNRALEVAGVQIPHFDQLMRSITARRGAAQRLVPAMDSAFTAFARNTAYVGPLSRAISDALMPLITQREATRETLQEAPATLSAANSGLARGVRLIKAVRHLSSAAAETLPPAPAGVEALSEFLDTGGPVLKRSRNFVAQSRAGLNAPWDLLPPLDPIRPRLNELFKNVRPLLRELDDHSCDFKNGVATLRSMTGYEQPAHGPLGPGMAFRMLLVAPTADGVGLNGAAGGFVKRATYPKDCTYDSKPYPQFNGTSRPGGER